MKIILHRTGKGWVQRIYGIVCQMLFDSPFGHVSVVDSEGIRYEASASKGEFVVAKPFKSASNRAVTVIDLPDIFLSREDLLEFIGVPYDYIGAFLIWSGCHNKNKIFCFEAAGLILRKKGVNFVIPRVFTGKHLLDRLVYLGYPSMNTVEGRV